MPRSILKNRRRDIGYVMAQNGALRSVRPGTGGHRFAGTDSLRFERRRSGRGNGFDFCITP